MSPASYSAARWLKRQVSYYRGFPLVLTFVTAPAAVYAALGLSFCFTRCVETWPSLLLLLVCSCWVTAWAIARRVRNTLLRKTRESLRLQSDAGAWAIQRLSPNRRAAFSIMQEIADELKVRAMVGVVDAQFVSGFALTYSTLFGREALPVIEDVLSLTAGCEHASSSDLQGARANAWLHPSGTWIRR